MIKRWVFSLVLIITISNQLLAASSDKPIIAAVTITKNQNQNGYLADNRKKVVLMSVNLTKKQLQSLNNLKLKLSTHRIVNTTVGLPSSYQVGMNNVPVLDQGWHGSCVTFAITAAIDALLGKNDRDYVSQLCQLELGSHLEKNGYFPSGWMGSNDEIVLNQIKQFGIVSKEKQLQGLCAGVKDYPLNDMDDNGKPITIEEYKLLSESLINIESGSYLHSDPLLTSLQRFEWDPENLGAEKTLIKLKQFLAQKNDADIKGKHLIFATLLPVGYCSAGACAKFHEQDDTWALTEAMKNDPDLLFGGHEMIITGYDDNAIAIDRDGNKHQGLLTLRNSWSEEVGDHGDYYMTYDFFKAFVMDIQKLYLVND